MWASGAFIGCVTWSLCFVWSQPVALRSEGTAGGMAYACRSLWNEGMVLDTEHASIARTGKTWIWAKLSVRWSGEYFPCQRECGTELVFSTRKELSENSGREGEGPFKESSIWEETLQSIIQQTILPRDFQKFGHFRKDEFSSWFCKAQEALAPVILYFLLSIFYEVDVLSQPF